MRAPGKSAVSDALVGLREPMATSLPLSVPLSPSRNALAIPPAPMMPQRMGLFVPAMRDVSPKAPPDVPPNTGVNIY